MAFIYLDFPMIANPAGNETNSVGLKKKKNRRHFAYIFA